MILVSTFAACVIAQTATSPVDLLRTAPEIPPWPAGLAEPVPQETGGHCLDAALSKAVTARLMMLDAYPARCQVRLDGLLEVCAAERRAAVDVALAEAVRLEAQPPTGYVLTTVIAWAAGALVVGMVAGSVAVVVINAN